MILKFYIYTLLLFSGAKKKRRRRIVYGSEGWKTISIDDSTYQIEQENITNNIDTYLVVET